MSGPKILDIAATRQAERLRIQSHCLRLDALAARHRDSVVGTRAAEVAAALRAEAAQAARVDQLIAIRERAAARLAFLRSEAARSLDESLNRSAHQRAAVRETIERRLAREADPAVRAAIADALCADDPATRLRLFGEALERNAHHAGEDEADLAAITGWLEEIGIAETSPHGSQPVPAPPRWRVEVERIRAESAVLAADSPAAAADIEAALARIDAEADPARRQLLLDGLRYPLAEALRQAREAAARAALAAEWRAALAAHPDSLDLAAWNARLDSGEPVSEDQVDQAIAAAIALESARAARGEILRTLGELGYELRPGMESAFVENGRVVVRKPADIDFGVELSATSHGSPGLLRARVVRTTGQPAATPEERQRDLEREQSWCADREAVTERLSHAGVEVTLKAARPAGEIPVPVVATESTQRESSRRAEGNIRALAKPHQQPPIKPV